MPKVVTIDLHLLDQCRFPEEGDAVAADRFIAGIQILCIFFISDLLQGPVAVFFHFRLAGGTLCLYDHGAAVVYICEKEIRVAGSILFLSNLTAIRLR